MNNAMLDYIVYVIELTIMHICRHHLNLLRTRTAGKSELKVIFKPVIYDFHCT